MTQENKLILSLEDFHPAKEALMLLSEKAKATDITSLEHVHDTRIQLRDARISLTKRGKEMRDGALKFQKDVISKEKELLGIIEPEEERLEKIEEQLKLKKEMEDRRTELPTRIAALATIGDKDIVIDEDELLAMDDKAFNEYRIRRIDAKLEYDRKEFEAKKIAEAETARKLALEEDAKRRAKIEEEEKALREKHAEEDKKLSAEREAIAAERAKLDAEKKAAEDAEAKRLRDIELKEREAKLEADRKATEEADLQKASKYQEWLEGLKFNPETDMVNVDRNTGVIAAYRLLGVYDPKKK